MIRGLIGFAIGVMAAKNTQAMNAPTVFAVILAAILGFVFFYFFGRRDVNIAVATAVANANANAEAQAQAIAQSAVHFYLQNGNGPNTLPVAEYVSQQIESQSNSAISTDTQEITSESGKPESLLSRIRGTIV